MTRSAKTLEVPGTCRTTASISSGDALQFGEVGSGDFDADRRFDARGQHVDPRLDRHRPGVVQAGELHRGVHRVGQFVHRAPAMRDGLAVLILDVDRRPVLLVLQHDGCLDHVHRRGIGGGLGATNFAEDMVHFGKAFDDFVGLLKNLAGFGRRNSGKRGRHVEQVAFVKRRHELRAEILIWEKFSDRERRVPQHCPPADDSSPADSTAKKPTPRSRRRRQ